MTENQEKYLKNSLKELDSFMTKYLHMKLIPFVNYILNIGIALYLVSTIYNTIFLNQITTLDFTVNPQLYINPIFWHLNQGFHHTWDLLIIFGFYFLMTKIYKIPPILSAFNILFIISFHEMLWYISYYISHIYTNTFFRSEWLLSPVQLSYIITILSYIYIQKKSNKLVRPLLFMYGTSIIFIAWTVIGFPITYDFTGYTKYWYSIIINLIEINSWLFPVMFYWNDIVLK